jgi:hypothetical protein
MESWDRSRKWLRGLDLNPGPRSAFGLHLATEGLGEQRFRLYKSFIVKRLNKVSKKEKSGKPCEESVRWVEM